MSSHDSARQLAQNIEAAAKNLTEIAGRFSSGAASFGAGPVPGLGRMMVEAFARVAEDYARNPTHALAAQKALWEAHFNLWQQSWRRLSGADWQPAIESRPDDRRFRDPLWSDNPFFDFLKQSYLLSAKWAHDVVDQAGDIDPETRQRAEFYVEQLASAFSPTNFLLANPELLRLTLETRGQNLVDGLAQLKRDLDGGNGVLHIRQTGGGDFRLGETLAVTPGKVIYQNALMQLIQYAPSTPGVHRTPLLIVPPWINKFYILDLNQKKSFVRWAVSQGLTVFIISWVNADASLAQMGMEDYVRLGVSSALDAITEATGARRINAAGYCIGGTLLALALGMMAQKNDRRIKSATFFATQVDFEHAGDLKAFIDEQQLSDMEKTMEEKGYFSGKSMGNAFNMLRSRDLIWPYFVENYLKGKTPRPFDLLHWSNDSTNIPAKTHSFYLRQCYLYNNMSQKKMILDGVNIDLSKIKIPVYNLAAREDHIAPLESVFRIGEFFGGPVRLVVAGSGHIAGVINPPEANKYCYWTNEAAAETPTRWLEAAQCHKGSWWPDWLAWIQPHSGAKIKPREIGGGKLVPLEDAPGSYVRKSCDGGQDNR